MAAKSTTLFLACAVLLVSLEASATACLPPEPGWVPPTAEELVRGAARSSSDIVCGVLTRGSSSRR